ncbi:LTA synthase family protein [Helicobacter cappadocius]|uniref:Sulfatase-like hydrolase/transferase n=1 Tax=Helicobacter cappadocius TaxID=3063998 RepID=A0AA90PIZ7_9HELI|nr:MULTISPECIES: alkaline phosphatase family protein [unclassified Helicobacter]MDO7252603.1 sulfatase-like hydrolase/transferase [Helicobacter sp. faydin-H75]MDP2538470.1 sulfatase-like hydrolase/transferase [Helicobacter sp. faydin-H76]
MRIFSTILKTISFTLFLAFLFICIRICFILYTGIYQNAMGEVSFYDIINTLINGSKYDNKTVAFASVMFLILGILLCFFSFQKYILNVYAGVIFFICIFLGISNIAFFSIFGNVFDNNLLGLINDDKTAIFKTGLQGNYYIGTKIIILILCTAISIFIYNKFSNLVDSFFLRKFPKKYPKISSLIAFGILCIIMLIFITSHLGFKEISLDMNTKFSKDPFLKKITPGAFRNLYVVYHNYKANSTFFYNKSPIDTTKSFFNLPLDSNPPFDLSILLQHTSTNIQKAPQIKHIFYIVSESLSEWNFDNEFNEIGLMSGLKSLIDGKHGLKIKHFIENADVTIRSLDVQITGLFNFDTALNSKAGIMPLFPTAVGGIMKKLGYETRFYYGGSEAWQQLDIYTHSEGFDKIFGNTDLLEYTQDKSYPKPLENIWGVYDPILFDYLIDNTAMTQNPTFNMVMTTSNHPPYDVDLKHYNVPMDKINTFLKTHISKKEFNHNEDVATMLGHAWWYDKQVTKFIKEASKRFPQSLFIITGDHYGRMYVRAKLNNQKGKSIPLIVYSPILTPKQLYNIGSHIDIAPTIVELVSPKGFKYSSFGKPLLSNNHANKYHEDGYALGYYVIATNRFIYVPNMPIEYFKNTTPIPSDQKEAKKLYEKLEEAKAISWWMFTNGNIIK